MQETVRSSFPESMLLIIAHRLQTIADCTRVAIMSDGALAEIGAGSRGARGAESEGREPQLCWRPQPTRARPGPTRRLPAQRGAGTPRELLEKPGGRFRSLADELGPAELAQLMCVPAARVVRRLLLRICCWRDRQAALWRF